MKNSTRRNSSKRPSIENVRGILFFDPEHTPLHITVETWEKKGCPPDCYVYDGIHQLLTTGIPIADAVECEGRWIRIPIHPDCPPTRYFRSNFKRKLRVRASGIKLVHSLYMTSEDTKKRKIR